MSGARWLARPSFALPSLPRKNSQLNAGFVKPSRVGKWVWIKRFLRGKWKSDSPLC